MLNDIWRVNLIGQLGVVNTSNTLWYQQASGDVSGYRTSQELLAAVDAHWCSTSGPGNMMSHFSSEFSFICITAQNQGTGVGYTDSLTVDATGLGLDRALPANVVCNITLWCGDALPWEKSIKHWSGLQLTDHTFGALNVQGTAIAEGIAAKMIDASLTSAQGITFNHGVYSRVYDSFSVVRSTIVDPTLRQLRPRQSTSC